MGLLDKVKNMFTEEVEEEPIKSEMIQVEIPAPTKMVEPKENSITDNPSVKQEEKSTAPIFFDDAYFKELEKPKQEVKSSYKKEPVKVQDKKTFKPTPIISPVYGVLDKNYSKEDITSKKEKHPRSTTSSSPTIDEVRKKAFGTLEDELETTLFGNNSILFNDVVEKQEEEQKKELLDDLIEDIDIQEEPVVIQEEDKPIGESELFDLIDTMYEKGE